MNISINHVSAETLTTVRMISPRSKSPPAKVSILHQVHSKSKGWKTKYVKDLGAIKPKGLNRIAKIGSVHLCPREVYFSFINNYIIKQL